MGSCLAVSHTLGLALRTKILCSDPSIARNIRIVGQIEQVVEPHLVIYKELGRGWRVKTEQFYIPMVVQRK
jgi:hypothetical protein